MKILAGIVVFIFYAALCGAQPLPPPAAAPIGGSASEQGAPSATNLPPPAPPKDPAQCVIARFSFENTVQPDIGGGATIPVTFARESAAYLEGAPVAEGAPRFVEGRSGRAILLESAYENMFSIGLSCAEDATSFRPLPGAELALSSERPWQGKTALSVTTKGENAEEGFCAEVRVEKALYTKESSPAIAPAFYLASLYLKGRGNIKITLKDVESGECGETVYAELSDNWQRFSCSFAYAFKRVNIGANHETDWKKSLPPEAGLDARLQLICATVDSQKLDFLADGLQLEQRYAAGRNAELSPHSWVMGAFRAAHEQMTIDIRNDYFNSWKKSGSIAFWFKPMWDARDGGAELILQIATNQLVLSHRGQKIVFAPAGVSFTPYDWKNNWHYFVLAWNETGERMLYVDGMDYPNPAGETRLMKKPEFVVAGDFFKNLSPNGAIDELIFYNIALNSEQARSLAAAEPAPDRLAPVPAPAAAPLPASGPPAVSNAPPPAAAGQDESEEEEE
ncbi:MAG: hypothetical protein PHP98_02840 [Kiritimatiellae bacterium]|nr:hypothetical protein [Kiritimatiellia bacterium]